jgi:hypothetical protein
MREWSPYFTSILFLLFSDGAAPASMPMPRFAFNAVQNVIILVYKFKHIDQTK